MKPIAIALLLSLPAVGQVNSGDRAPVVLGGTGSWLDRLRGPYVAKRVPPIDFRNSNRIYDLLRAGNLYLSLPDAIALAIENNLDVEISRFDILAAKSDLLRAQGGGTLRGVSTAITQLAAGVGGPASPLLTTAASSATPSTSVPSNVTELSALASSQGSLSILPESYSAGPPLPMFDPAILGNVTWEHQNTPQPSSFATGNNTLISNSTTASLSLQQGFSPGTQYSLAYNSTSQNVNSLRTSYNPYTTGSLGLTITQPLLRGFGPAVNRRFIRIARNNERVGSQVFRQQLINAVYGVSRLYYDLVALNQDLRVKQGTLSAARTLYENTKAGVEEGTLAPLELTRAQAQVAGAEQDLVNSQGLLEEQEVIVKRILTRGAADPAIHSSHIVPTEPLDVPAQEPILLHDELMTKAFANRPDLSVAGTQVDNSRIYLHASRNELLPELNLVGIGQGNGLSGQPNAAALSSTSSTGIQTGAVQPSLVGGYGTSLAEIFRGKYPTYGIGLQLMLPLRNRIAQADVERDEVQFRQAQARLQQFRNQAQLEIDDAIIGLRRARASYDAAVKTRILQEQALEIEHARYEAGVDTAFFVIQYQSYVAQARSTEVVAKGNYWKAKAALDRATATNLESNNISFDEAFHGRITRAPATLP
jgi:outer membrane protein